MQDATKPVSGLANSRRAVNPIKPAWIKSSTLCIKRMGMTALLAPNSQTAGAKNSAEPGISQAQSAPTQNSLLATRRAADATMRCSSGKTRCGGK